LIDYKNINNSPPATIVPDTIPVTQLQTSAPVQAVAGLQTADIGKKKYRNIAVLYRGHLRTWDSTKNLNFVWFDLLSEKVDYYFVTWNEPFYDKEKIKQDFNDRNLVKLLFLDREKKFYNAIYSSAWMLANISPYILENDAQYKYDVIIELRPDHAILKLSFNDIEENTYYTCFEGYNSNFWPMRGVTDQHAVYKSDVLQKLSEKFKMPYVTDLHCPEVYLRNFLINEGIQIVADRDNPDRTITTQIIRPNFDNLDCISISSTACILFYFDKNNINDLKISWHSLMNQFEKLENDWRTNFDWRIEVVEEKKYDLREYIFPVHDPSVPSDLDDFDYGCSWCNGVSRNIDLSGDLSKKCWCFPND